ncbi:MAG: diadenylate cyclase [Rhodothermales bacterium]
MQAILEEVCCQQCYVDPGTLEEVLVLAVEIAREGREGRKIGTLFVIGDVESVMTRSRALILDPLLGHPETARSLSDPNCRETIKELAQLDGGFVVSGDGIVVSAARYFDASSGGIELPLGLGSRHMAGASISKYTSAVAVVVSESSVVRIFNDGEVISEIIPELWMLRRHGLVLRDDATTRVADDVVVVSKR